MGKPVTRRRFLSIMASTAACAGAAGWPLRVLADVPLQTWQGFVMGSEASIKLAGLTAAEFKTLQQECLSEMRRLEAVFSLYDPASAICRLNRDGQLENPPSDLLRCLDQAIRITHLTDGAFDVTVQPLWDLYAHYKGKPPGTELKKILEKIGTDKVVVGPGSVYFAVPGMAITLNGIAQGYITDRVTELLRKRGLGNVLVEMGETRALGTHPSGRPWAVGIRDPGFNDKVWEVVSLADQALATSGGYGTPLEDDANHLLDPGTGEPFSLYKSLSVIASTATEADGLSTGLSGLKSEKIKEVINKNPSLAVIAIDAAGQIIRL